MPLDEREKEQLAKRIKEQRRAMWKGEAKTKRPKKKQENKAEASFSTPNHESTIQMWERQRGIRKTKRRSESQKTRKPESRQEHRKVEQTSEPRYGTIADSMQEHNAAGRMPAPPNEVEQASEPRYGTIADSIQERNAAGRMPALPNEVEQASAIQDERAKTELAEKIEEQRRAMWRGESKAASRTKRRESKKSSPTLKRGDLGTPVLARQQEHGRAEQTLDQQLDKPKARENRGFRLNVPTLKLALLVIIGLIAAIIIGVAVGYVAAVRDLIKI
jgi:hypothetical protein